MGFAMPLEDITLTQLQYGDVVSQIFDGVPIMLLSIPHPPSVQMVPPVRERKYFDSYLAKLGNDTTTRGDVESIYERMTRILADREAEEQRVSGLVVGRVQSGKTRNYVGLILKAVDEGWNVVIVLTSANTALVKQTTKRLQNDFERAGAHGQVQLTFHHAANARNNNTAPTQLLDEHNTAFYWAVAMKQTHSLQGLLGWLKANPACVPHMRILIIDDEADNATPDSNSGRPNQMSESEIDELIAGIRDEEERDYSDLADWMEELPERIEEKIGMMPEEIQECFEEKRTQEINMAALPQEVRELVQTLLDLKTRLSTGATADKFREILTNHQFCEFLGIVDVIRDGQVFTPRQDIEAFFYQGRGERSRGRFISFLNTVLSVAVSRSAINRYICELIDRVQGSTEYAFPFQRCAYIAYTATPYANILNERPDQTPLYADFIKSLSITPQYFGLEKIFGRYRKDMPVEPNMNIVDDLGDDDKRFALNPIQGIQDAEKKEVLAVTIGDDLRYECHNPEQEGSWDSLKRALAWAFCTAGARRWFRREVYLPRIENDPKLSAEEKAEKKKKCQEEVDYRWTTMLMNISQSQATHALLHRHVTRYLRTRCESLEAREGFLRECQATWNELTRTYTKADFDGAFNRGEGDDYGPIDDYPAWEAIQGDVRYFLDRWNDSRVHPIIINAANTANRDIYNDASLPDDHLWILIGGNTIGRGLTLAGLTTSFFDRVRKNVAVDTLTQMGRWFGYRKDYELLPRLWMTKETVCVMKKTAFVEEEMHASMKENFDAGHSPCDPEHYQKIYSFGCKLSGRSRAQTRWMKSLGTMTTTGQLSVRRDDMTAIYDLACQFIQSLGAQTYRDPTIYRNTKRANFPLWTKVDRNTIRNYLTAIIPFQAAGMRQTLRALIGEIEKTSESDPAARWDVVIGEPANHRGGRYDIVPGGIFSGNPTAKVYAGVARYGSVREDLAFYTMIPTDILNRTDAQMLEEGFKDVLAKLETKLQKNGVAQQALAPYAGSDPEEQLRALIAHVKANPATEVPAAIRDCLPQGFRNLSTFEYREAVYANAGHKRPILQFYLLTPPEGAETDTVPLIAHAVYWPDHASDEFDLNCVGMEIADKRRVPGPRAIEAAIVEILRQNDFPLSVARLRTKLQQALPDCPSSAISQLKGGSYLPFPGKEAYYLAEWSMDPVEDLHRFIRERAVEILRDGQPHERRDLAQQIFAENPKLEGLMDLGNSAELKTLFAPEYLAGRGIALIKKKPVIFQMQS